MKLAYAVPAIADQGSVVARTLGVANLKSLEPTANFKQPHGVNPIMGETNPAAGESSESSVNSRSTE
jgi:hypothetical protein